MNDYSKPIGVWCSLSERAFEHGADHAENCPSNHWNVPLGKRFLVKCFPVIPREFFHMDGMSRPARPSTNEPRHGDVVVTVGGDGVNPYMYAAPDPFKRYAVLNHRGAWDCGEHGAGWIGTNGTIEEAVSWCCEGVRP